jgi:hypothetical protein
MKLARVFCFLIILGSSAIAAYAQTPIDPSSLNGDVHVALNDPTCSFTFCVALVVTGEHPVDSFFFPIVPGGTYIPPFKCDVSIEGQDWKCRAVVHDGKFMGFLFYQPDDDALSPGTPLDFSSNIPIALMLSGNTACVPASACPKGELAPLLFTPEPRSSVLFITGLLLFSLGGFARKRLGANSHT